MGEYYEVVEKRVRDTIIFTVGVAGSVNEIWFQADTRPYILTFLASLIGVPFILLADAKRRRERDGQSDEQRG